MANIGTMREEFAVCSGRRTDETKIQCQTDEAAKGFDARCRQRQFASGVCRLQSLTTLVRQRSCKRYLLQAS